MIDTLTSLEAEILAAHRLERGYQWLDVPHSPDGAGGRVRRRGLMTSAPQMLGSPTEQLKRCDACDGRRTVKVRLQDKHWPARRRSP